MKINGIHGLNLVRRLFNEHKFNVFLDYGTLLGHIRDDDPCSLARADDIDISILNPTNLEIESLCATVASNNYTPQVINCSNLPIMVKFISLTGEPPIDLHIYRYSTPETVFFPLFNYLEKSKVIKLVNKINFIRTYVKRRAVSFSPFDIDENNILGRNVYSIKYTCFKAELIKNVVIHNGLPVPKMYSDLLKSHYGNWGVPKAKWDFWKDQCDLYESIVDYVQ